MLRAAGALGLRVPDQLSVVGFDDGDLAATIGLTTVRQPLEASGALAVRLLRARLAGEVETTRTLLRVRLTLRTS